MQAVINLLKIEAKLIIKSESMNLIHIPPDVDVDDVLFFVLLLIRRRLCDKKKYH